MKERKAGANSIKSRHNERRKKRIREQKIRRCIFFSVLGLIAVLLIMFLTPLFNIRTVNIEGNVKLGSEQITTQIGDYTGDNLFAASKRKIKKSLRKLAYVERVDVKKKPIPPTLTIKITEYKPTVQILYGDVYVVIEENGKVLEHSAEMLEGIAVCDGVSIVSVNVGEQISAKDEDVLKTVLSCIKSMKKADILKDITTMSFIDMTNITFNYQSRLDVICGTPIEFDRKLALFKEAVNSNKLTQNSRGTINLSTTGKAIWTP